MSETELHAPFLGYRGTIGKLVYKKYKGRTIVSHKPGRRTKKNEEGAPQTKVFGTGITYAKKAMAKPAVRAFYQERAKALETPIFALAVGDYLNAPTIEELDFDEYMGQVGDLILITTHDDVGVVHLEVSLTAADGTPIEKGLAVEPTPFSGTWVYTATAPVAAGTDIFVEAEGFDRAGNRATCSANPTVKSPSIA